MQESFWWQQCSNRYTISLALFRRYLSEDSRNKIGANVQNKGGGTTTFLKTAEIRLVRMRRPREVDWCQSWWKKMDCSCMDRKRVREKR